MNQAFTLRESRVLVTQWVGQAWEEAQTYASLVKSSFRQCGISLPVDGSADHELSIADLPDYKIGSMDSPVADPLDVY